MTELAEPQHIGAGRKERLTEWSARELAHAIASRQLTSREVVQEHISMLERNKNLGAIARGRFAEALADADRADDFLASAHRDTPLPPLCGVPFTVKEFIAVRGLPNSAGFPHRRNVIPEEDAPAIARLRAAGGIVLGVTNSAGPVFWMETYNPLYGRVNNPYDLSRTAGGSSGGDGAAVACGGSPVSIGSDLGGSLRIPAFFNGVFAHLPSVGLVPTTGHFPMANGDARKTLFLGPVTRRAEDLHLVLQVIGGPHGSDPVSALMPLGDPENVRLSGLRVVLATGATLTKPRADLETARFLAGRMLEAQGAQVTEVSLPALRWTIAQALAALSSSLDFASIVAEIVGASNTANMSALRSLATAPVALLRLAEAAPARRLRTRAARRLVDGAQKAADHLTELLGDGALLFPPFPRLAPRHFTTYGQPWLASNTIVFNILGLPVTQVPTGLNSSGLPLGLQVAAAPGNDHVALRVAMALEAGFGGWSPPRRG
ncbi:amidase [Hoyosella subflava]|uniref:Amidase domain-containing protein n=1 Tax=Hoyosella subflava (strain DSM 45089 / JCM 17490 / NBRC 109087 / DQS3-9A1) TaxID=443218 RepID=F6EJJ7_HOYSD|nr:amidase [Hoyosella subflava]AEF39046.1 hypothetical protein AS9A_0592 [Hoyosella subflava DQS3-9A1]